MNAVSLNNLWNYLQGLSLSASNQRWLGERLIEASSATKSEPASLEESTYRVRKRRRALSDAELAERLARYAPLTDADFPEIGTEAYANFAKNSSGHITKGFS